MKTKVQYSILILFVISFCLSCGQDELQPLEDADLTLINTNYSDCKGLTKSNETEQYISLKAVGDDALKIEFENALLNCCPGSINASAAISNGFLEVGFAEEEHGCKCVCYYDLETTVTSMEKREYKMNVMLNDNIVVSTFTFEFKPGLDLKIEIKNE